MKIMRDVCESHLVLLMVTALYVEELWTIELRMLVVIPSYAKDLVGEIFRCCWVFQREETTMLKCGNKRSVHIGVEYVESRRTKVSR